MHCTTDGNLAIDTKDAIVDIRHIIAEELDLDISDVRDDAHFKDDLGATSLKIVVLVIKLEKQFNLTISDGDLQKIATVRDVLEFIEDQGGQPADPVKTRESIARYLTAPKGNSHNETHE